ncbi:hypothetical protein PTKIN_Ptkin03bG0158200 [Pterospermum kingtungense]
MAAVEEKQNSLVGCVVWRRNHGPSSSTTKKHERKHSSWTEQPLSSQSEQKVLESNFPCTQPAQKSHPITCTSIGSAIINKNEGDHVEGSNIQLALHNSPANANLLPMTSSSSNFSSISVGVQTSFSDSVPPFGPKGQSSEREMPLIESGTEKPESCLELQNHVLPLSSVITKDNVPALDDDDLPEFDFGAVCGISKTPRNKVLDASMSEKNVLIEGLKKIVGSLPLTSSTIQSLPGPNKRRAENFLLPDSAFNTILNLPPEKKVCGHRQISLLRSIEAKQTTRSSTTFTPVVTTIVAPQKNIFDDDDDIPEWCPPNVDLLKQTFLESAKVVATSIHPSSSNSKLGSSSPSHPSPLFPSLASHLSFATLRSSYANHCPVTSSVKPAQPRQTDRYMRGDPSLMRFNSSYLLRPPLHPFWMERQRALKPSNRNM